MRLVVFFIAFIAFGAFKPKLCASLVSFVDDCNKCRWEEQAVTIGDGSEGAGCCYDDNCQGYDPVCNYYWDFWHWDIPQCNNDDICGFDSNVFSSTSSCEGCPVGEFQTLGGTCSPASGCGFGEFECDNGGCIPEANACDGWDDCSLGEDEEGCGGFFNFIKSCIK